MIRSIFVTTLLLLCLNVEAQQSFTDSIQAREPGKGIVTLHQSQAITDLVNGVATDSTGLAGTDLSINGFRIQVYAGGNSRRDKIKAENAGSRVRDIVPTERVYTNFISPRWVCRIGDYRSFEEAYKVLSTLQTAGGFNDAVIVKSKVQVFIH